MLSEQARATRERFSRGEDREVERRHPWPAGTLVVDLDGMQSVSIADLEALERRSSASIGVIVGECEGPALAAALAVDLLVASPQATFGRAGAGPTS